MSRSLQFRELSSSGHGSNRSTRETAFVPIARERSGLVHRLSLWKWLSSTMVAICVYLNNAPSLGKMHAPTLK
jgi:hypothetical protein